MLRERLTGIGAQILRIFKPPLPVKSFSVLKAAIYSLTVLYSGWFCANFLLKFGTELLQRDKSDLNQLQTLASLNLLAWLILGSTVICLAILIKMNKTKKLNPAQFDGKNVLYHLLRGGVLSLLVFTIFLHIRLLFLTRVVVEGDSMATAIRTGDSLWIEKLSIGIHTPELSFPLGNPFKYPLFPAGGLSLPKRGEIIVIQHPGADQKNLVKRVIGLPGDHFLIKDGFVSINGSRLEEGYLSIDTVTRPLPDIYQPPLTKIPDIVKELSSVVEYSALFGCGHQGVVPEKTVLVLGDNRRHSRDSRSIGFVPVFFISGKVIGH